MGQERTVEGALPAKHQTLAQFRKKNDKKSATSNSENTGNNSLHSKDRSSKRNYPPCRYCGKLGHPSFKCWKRSDAKCSKCNQMGHQAVICNNKLQKRETSIQVRSLTKMTKIAFLWQKVFHVRTTQQKVG